MAREGTKKTVFTNFMELSKSMNRNHEHVQAFLLAELGTSGGWWGRGGCQAGCRASSGGWLVGGWPPGWVVGPACIWARAQCGEMAERWCFYASSVFAACHLTSHDVGWATACAAVGRCCCRAPASRFHHWHPQPPTGLA